jgi:hypothetical protein
MVMNTRRFALNPAALALLGGSVCVAATLVLSGCSSPAPLGTGGASDSSSAGSDGSSDGSSDGGASTVELPEGFPSDKVPLIDGEIVQAQHPGNTWGVWIRSSDLPGDLAKASDLLVAAGYEKVISSDDYADFHGSEYQVHVTAKDDPKYGSTILYSFYHVK